MPSTGFIALLAWLICSFAAVAAPLNMAVRGTPDSVRPGGTISLAVTVSNSGSTTMDVNRPTFVVPTYAKANNVAAGNTFFMGSGGIKLLPGESYTYLAQVLVLDSNPATGDPTPDGQVLNFNVSATATNPSSSASASTTVLVSTEPNLALHLSPSDDASAQAASTALTYTLTYSNPTATEVQGTTLRFNVPAGCTFTSADGGDSSFANNTVTWNIGTVAAGGSGVRHVTVQVGAAFTAASLITADSTFSDGQDLSARCRAVVAVKPNARLSMSIVTAESSVKPGGIFRAIINVINRGNTTLSSVEIGYNLPGYTFLRQTHIPETYRDLPPGESTAVLVAFRVQQDDPANGLFAPPDGTMIHLDAYATDYNQPVGAFADCAILVRSTPSLGLDVNSADEENTEAAGAKATFTYDFGNPGATDVALGKLTARVPAGCTFVSADLGGVHSNGIVTWDLTDIPAGTIGRRHMTVTIGAGITAKTQLQPEASLSAADEPSAAVHARHSVVLHGSAPLTFTIAATPELVKPGNVANVHFTIANRGTTTTNYVQIEFITPSHTKYSNFYDPGYEITLSTNALPVGEVHTAALSLPITNGNPAVNELAPSRGTFLPLVARIVDNTTGVTAVAKVNLVVDQPQNVMLDLTASDAAQNTTPGAAIQFTATYGNPGGALAAGGELVVKLPDGVTFNSADQGGTLEADGRVRFPIGPVGTGGTGKRTIEATIGAGVKSGTQLLAEAFITASDKSAQARARKAVSVRTAPQISLVVSAVPNPALPAETVQVHFDVTNHGLNTISALYVAFQIPNYTIVDNLYKAGQEQTQYLLSNIAPNQTHRITETFVVIKTDPGTGAVGPAGGTLLPVMAYAYNYSTYDTAVATTNVEVRGAITATADFVLLRGLGPVAIPVLKNDKTAAGKLKVATFTQAAHGSLVLNKATGTFTYKANASFTGSDSFTYTITNGSASATATVTISNPFLYFAGNYRLNLVDGNGNSAGFATVKMSNGGVFSGKIYQNGVLITGFRGMLDATGKFTGTFKPKGKPVVTLTLAASKPGAFAQITGTAQFGTGATLAIPASAVIGSLPAGYAAGEYNLLFETATNGGPEGIGWAELTLGADGKITLNGRLGDDSTFKSVSNLEANGSFTVFQQLYSTKGSLTGRLTLNAGTGVVQGTLSWSKAAKAPPATQFPLGFNVSLQVSGAPFEVVAQGGAQFAYPTFGARLVKVEYDEGAGLTLLGEATESGANDSFTPAAPNTASLTLIIERTTGRVSGSFILPSTSQKVTFTGLVNQTTNMAAGVFKTGDHSGAIVITPQ